MASKREKPKLKTIHDEFLTCKICFNTYNHPKILPCVHSYCAPCIQQLLQTSEKPGSIPCPICREYVTLPYGKVSDLKTNFLINGLIEVLKVKKHKDVECSACVLWGDDSPAVSRCLDCGDYLCLNCSDGHNSSSTTWKHRKVPLEDIEEGSYDRELRNIYNLTCSRHKDKEIEYFCEVCRIPICLACVLLAHRDHKCVGANEAAKSKKRRLISNVRKLREKMQHLKTENVTVRQHLASVQRHEAQAIAKIEQQAARILDKVERTKEHALQKVDTNLAKKLKECKSHVENTKLKIALATGCLEFCETMIEQGKDEEVLYLEDTITKRLQQLEDIPSMEDSPADKEVFPDVDKEASEIDESIVKPSVDGTGESNAILQSSNVQQTTSFKLLRTFNTEYRSDKLYPVVKSMTIYNKLIFISDSANRKIKCISTDGVLKEYLTAGESFSPFAIAVCKTVTAVVNENFLCLFNKKGKISKKVMLSAKSNTGLLFTFAIANYKNEGFIVGNLPDNHFRMYSVDGTLQKRFSAPLLYPLANISVDQNGNLVTCEWGDNSVRVRNLMGKTLTYCQVSPSWKAIAAHADTNGYIYAINNFASTISVFDREGTHIFQHATKPEGLMKPVNLAFDEEGFLYVVNMAGHINVYAVTIEDTL